MAVGPPGDGLVVIVRVVERRRAGVGGPGAACTLETAVRELPVTTLDTEHGGT